MKLSNLYKRFCQNIFRLNQKSRFCVDFLYSKASKILKQNSRFNIQSIKHGMN